MARKTRNLTDSEARWEAVNFIAAAAEDFIASGAIAAYGAERGWTEADMVAVDRHIRHRISGLIRRPRRMDEDA